MHSRSRKNLKSLSNSQHMSNWNFNDKNLRLSNSSSNNNSSLSIANKLLTIRSQMEIQISNNPYRTHIILNKDNSYNLFNNSNKSSKFRTLIISKNNRNMKKLKPNLSFHSSPHYLILCKRTF